MKKNVFSLLLIIGLVSCKTVSPENQARLQTLDSLKTVVAQVEKDLSSWQDSSLTDDVQASQELHSYLEKNYPVLDDRYFWITQMNALRRVYKGLGKFANYQQELNDQIPLAQRQLSGLQNSIKDDKLTEKEIEEFMFVETNETSKIYKLYSTYAPEAEICMGIWDTLKVQMRQIKTDLDTLQ
jgi:hypothetical protein